MSDKEQEYKELFISEALSNLEELNKLLTSLEENPTDKRCIDAIFRITHTLKGNALGMGFEQISKFAHLLEDIFALIKDGKSILNEEVFTSLFKSFDILSELTMAINEPDKIVRYRGLQRKLEVIIEKQSPVDAKVEEEKSAVVPKQKSKKEDKAIAPKSKEKKEEQSLSDAEEAPIQQIEEYLNAEEVEEDEVEDLSANKKIIFSDLVQVPVGKLDNLLNLVGELIIERDRLIAINEQAQSRSEFSRLTRISADLQYSVMDVRMVQVGFLFNKFYRVVRDAAKSEDKEVELIIEGSDTEIDRNILQIISDSLIHLIRNAIGHGIESPKDRKDCKKSAKGQLKLSARNESEGVLIEIKDDGKGIDLARIVKKVIDKGWVDLHQAAKLSDEEIISFIFQPGFSTSEQVNDISGRGVGMDVVKKALDSIGGNIKVTTEKGVGSTFSLTLPSSMAVKGTLLFEVRKSQYAIPLSYTESVLSVSKSDIKRVQNRLMITHLNRTVEAIYLKDLLFKDSKAPEPEEEMPEKLNVIIVHYSGRTVGFIVDLLLQQKEIVEKPLKKPVDIVGYISGVTIMGNGNVCLVINVPQIIQSLFSYSINLNNPVLA